MTANRLCSMIASVLWLALGSSPATPPARQAAKERPAGCSKADSSGQVIHATPRRARRGQRVHFRGKCFPRRWNFGYGIGVVRTISRPRGVCDLYISKGARFHVNKRGVIRGTLRITRRGVCGGGGTLSGSVRTPTGRYEIIAGCKLCAVGSLRVVRTKRK